MATSLWRSSFQVAVRSGRGVRGGVINGRRAASTSGAGGGNSVNLIIAAGVGIAGVTTFAVSMPS